jgi:hypothetical protein
MKTVKIIHKAVFCSVNFHLHIRQRCSTQLFVVLLLQTAVTLSITDLNSSVPNIDAVYVIPVCNTWARGGAVC